MGSPSMVSFPIAWLAAAAPIRKLRRPRGACSRAGAAGCPVEGVAGAGAGHKPRILFSTRPRTGCTRVGGDVWAADAEQGGQHALEQARDVDGWRGLVGVGHPFISSGAARPGQVAKVPDDTTTSPCHRTRLGLMWPASSRGRRGRTSSPVRAAGSRSSARPIILSLRAPAARGADASDGQVGDRPVGAVGVPDNRYTRRPPIMATEAVPVVSAQPASAPRETGERDLTVVIGSGHLHGSAPPRESPIRTRPSGPVKISPRTSSSAQVVAAPEEVPRRRPEDEGGTWAHSVAPPATRSQSPAR